MTKAMEMIISGFFSKGVNNLVDFGWNKIKDANNKRKSHEQNIETRIYQVTVDAINVFTFNEYKDQNILYYVAENILRGLKSEKENIEAVKKGLNMLELQIRDDRCVEFLGILCNEICKDENDILYKMIIMNQNEQIIEDVDKGFKRNEQRQENIIEDIQKGFERSEQNNQKTQRKLDYLVEKSDDKKEANFYSKIRVENRAKEYAAKWDKNVFLNNFDEEDENPGTEIKLKDIYIEECLPQYKWKTNSFSSSELKNLLIRHIIHNSEKKMLLILGYAGIGKSTLITWIMNNLVENEGKILVYQFANDLGSINWQGKNILTDIFNVIGLEYDELENKTLILDGFDEIYIDGDRERILNKLDQELKRRNILKCFSLIITCRENYIDNLQNIECDYIVLQAWNETQIRSFCKVYWEKCGDKISQDKIRNILQKKEIFGIPLILYMILALDVDIEKGSSKMDIYDQVFSLKRGGIYDRCYDVEHRINSPEIKKHIHCISQRIAFSIFEDNANKAYIFQQKFKEICNDEMSESGKKGENIQNDTLIGNFFKLKHCEGKDADELQFVHRSIYEYFVVIYFFEVIHKLTTEEEIAGKLGELLKKGKLSKEILEFIKCKFDSTKGFVFPDIIKRIFNIMLQDGMTYHMGTSYKNAAEQERSIFSNMLEVLGLWNSSLGELDRKVIIYLQCNREKQLNLKGIQLNVRNDDIEKVDLRGVLGNCETRNIVDVDNS